MDRVKLLIYVDILAFISFLVSVFSGFVLWQILPVGNGIQGGRYYIRLPRHDWINIHTISSSILVAVILYHLLLHWQWIKKIPQMIRK